MTTLTVNVPIKSAWLSKINWTQGVSAIASILVLVSGGEVNLSATDQAAIIVTIHIASAVVTWIWRTWFNGSVSPGSLPIPVPGGK